MIRMKMVHGLAFLMLGIAALPTVAQAAPQGGGSEHFPNDAACGGPLCNVDSPCIGCGPAALDVRLHVAGEASPKTATAALNAGDTGGVVADAAATALCTAFDVTPEWVCTPGCVFPANVVTCTNAGTGKAIDFSQISGTFSFSVVPGNADTRLNGLHCDTDAGNTHGPDLLDKVFIRVNANSHNGNVVFTVTGAPGPGLNPFTVNTTGKTDQQLHDEIRQGYAAIGLGAILHTASDATLSIAPSNFNGYFLEVLYPASVTQFEVNGQPGQILTTETNGTATSVPTISEWGMVSLVAILLLTGFWMLRRQRTQLA